MDRKPFEAVLVNDVDEHVEVGHFTGITAAEAPRSEFLQQQYRGASLMLLLKYGSNSPFKKIKYK